MNTTYQSNLYPQCQNESFVALKASQKMFAIRTTANEFFGKTQKEPISWYFLWSIGSLIGFIKTISNTSFEKRCNWEKQTKNRSNNWFSSPSKVTWRKMKKPYQNIFSSFILKSYSNLSIDWYVRISLHNKHSPG